MIIKFHKNFEKQYRKLLSKQKKSFKEKIKILLEDEFNPVLNSHPLRGKYSGYRSINVSGDLRAIYKRETKGNVVFVTIDKHSNLYK